MIDKIVELRDALLVESDVAAHRLLGVQTHERHSVRMYLAAIVDAWRILDREVTRLAEEE